LMAAISRSMRSAFSLAFSNFDAATRVIGIADCAVALRGGAELATARRGLVEVELARNIDVAVGEDAAAGARKILVAG